MSEEPNGIIPDGNIGQSPGQYLVGVVKWFSREKVYGFIALPDGGLDVFVHAKQLRGSGIHRVLEPGERVRFKCNAGHKGNYATDISLLND